MAVTFDQLQEWRDRLAEAKFSGIRTVRDSNGEEITYRSHTELAAALASLDLEIRKKSGVTRPATVHFATSKGI
ncbi:phage head-tail joining protein [Thioclava sp. GXIMD4215]|uniref:phage head-tail joining protein n=1 Tax=Thioclava sp. GXIMD4215 TaxID=3131928 RepID=UPI0032540282